MADFPQVYKDRPWHDDWSPLPAWCWWLWPLAWIPRRWTGLGLPMPPRKMWGNEPECLIGCQKGYPLAGDVEPDDLQVFDDWQLGPVPQVWGINPVHSPGPDGSARWSIQGAWFWGRRWPVYLTWSRMVGGRRLHFNGGPLAPLAPVVASAMALAGLGWWSLVPAVMLIGCKPDVTVGDWWWWFEFSMSWTKRKEA